MEIDQAAAAFYKRLDRTFVFVDRVASITFVNYQDIGMFEIGSARGMQRAIDDGSAFGQKLAPIGKELRVIVLTRQMRFKSGPDVNVHAVGILSRHPGSGLRRGSIFSLRPSEPVKPAA